MHDIGQNRIQCIPDIFEHVSVILKERPLASVSQLFPEILCILPKMLLHLMCMLCIN